LLGWQDYSFQPGENVLSYQQVLAAQDRLRAYVRSTPCKKLAWLDDWVAGGVYGKLEFFQRSGSFKFRGAMHALLQLEAQTRLRGVVTASAGNHGLGLAEAASELGVQAAVLVPETVTPLKLKKLQGLGVRLIVSGTDYDDAERAAQDYAQQNGMKFIHAFDDDEVIAGQGTIGAELLAESLHLGVVIVPVGGGGLLSGTSLVMKSLRPEIRIIGVQSEASPAMWAALQKGEVVETPIAETIADGLAGRYVTAKTLSFAQKFCDELVLVRESSIRHAMREIYSRHGWRVEGSAAVGVAAILEGKIHAAGRDCVTILSGGNIASATFRRQTAA
jgi:threonine dehydratase